MSELYPNLDNTDSKAIYYVEFDRERPETFTIFRRNFLCFTEVHPYNLFTAEYGPDGTVPDKAWVRFVVDALNAHCSGN